MGPSFEPFPLARYQVQLFPEKQIEIAQRIVLLFGRRSTGPRRASHGDSPFLPAECLIGQEIEGL